LNKKSSFRAFTLKFGFFIFQKLPNPIAKSTQIMITFGVNGNVNFFPFDKSAVFYLS
jgi:hypothetical protein